MKTYPPAWVFALLLFPGAALASSLADEIATTGDGRVAYHYESRPDVCGNGRDLIGRSDEREWSWGWGWVRGRHRDCRPGPVRIELRMRDGEAIGIETTVGGEPPEFRVRNLGEVPVPRAVDFLLELAWTARSAVAEDAMFAATLGKDAVVWPELLEIARSGRPGEVRKAALFWVGQAAGEAVAARLETLVEDDDQELEVRESAVFALSQRPSRESVPALSRIARTSRHPQVRKTALFWLAQHDDPRVTDLFEEILLGR